MESRAVIEKSGTTLIIQKRGSSRWLFPGGTVSPGEDPWETLSRVLDEQFTNCPIAGPLVILPNSEPQTTIFLVKVDGVVVPNPQEITDARWVDPVAKRQEYKLSRSIIGSIKLLRKKRVELARQLSKPPPVLE